MTASETRAIHLLVPIEGLMILSLIFSPMPLRSTFGYPSYVVIWSLVLGVVLSGAAFATATGLASRRAHLITLAVLGAVCLGLSLAGMPAEAHLPRVMFQVYGGIMLFESLLLAASMRHQVRFPVATVESVSLARLRTDGQAPLFASSDYDIADTDVRDPDIDDTRRAA